MPSLKYDISVEPPPPTNTNAFFTFLVAPLTVYVFSSFWEIMLKSNFVSALNLYKNSLFSSSPNCLNTLVPHTNISFLCNA